MTPKERANHLFCLFIWETGNDTFAKKCALVAVEQILFLDAGDAVDEDYWLEVKEELEKL